MAMPSLVVFTCNTLSDPPSHRLFREARSVQAALGVPATVVGVLASGAQPVSQVEGVRVLRVRVPPWARTVAGWARRMETRLQGAGAGKGWRRAAGGALRRLRRRGVRTAMGWEFVKALKALAKGGGRPWLVHAHESDLVVALTLACPLLPGTGFLPDVNLALAHVPQKQGGPAHVEPALRLYEEPALRGDGTPDDIDREVIAMVPPGVESLADLGCGTGAVVNHFHAAGLRTLGVDISGVALEKVRGPALRVDAAAVPSLDTFDVVVLSRVLEHLDDSTFRRCLSEARRLATRYIVAAAPFRERLALGRTRCVWCRRLFHTSNHLRPLHPRRVARELEPAFRLRACKRVGSESEPYPALLWWLRTRLLGIWPRDLTRVCPFCGCIQVVHPEREYHGLSATLDHLALRWRRKTGPTHFVGLLEREVH